MVSFIRFAPQEGHVMLHCFLSVRKLATLPYSVIGMCEGQIEMLC